MKWCYILMSFKCDSDCSNLLIAGRLWYNILAIQCNPWVIHFEFCFKRAALMLIITVSLSLLGLGMSLNVFWSWVCHCKLTYLEDFIVFCDLSFEAFILGVRSFTSIFIRIDMIVMMIRAMKFFRNMYN